MKTKLTNWKLGLLALAGVLMLSCPLFAQSQFVVKGVVTDENDEYIAGVSVLNTNSKQYATSDLEGKYGSPAKFRV